jgi:probable F420-dependent oxidoreductase
VHLGVSLPSVGPAPDREFLLPVAEAADRLGFHSVWASDHFALPADRRSVYPYPESTTEVAFTPGVMWLDPVAVMAFVAGVTRRVLIGTSVLVLPYRAPLVLANEVATIDRISEGRVLLGVGAGWMEEEFRAAGVPIAERGARTDEYIEVLRLMWRERRPASFDGRFVSFDGLELATAPHSPTGPPILVGGNTKPALRRAARLGDGWLGFEVFLDQVGGMVSEIEKTAEEAGRDPSALMLSVRRGLRPPFQVTDFLSDRRSISGSPDQVAEELSAYRRAGVELMVFDLTMLPAEIVETMEWLAAEVAPLLD